MKIEPIMLEISQKVAHFDPITLAEMDGVKLMNRTDAKFVVPLQLLPSVLDDLLPHYRLLEIKEHRLSPYQTLYFDTPALQLYHEHQTGRLNRYKIRQRNYVHSNLIFTEVKFKNNKGRTLKNRIRQHQLPNADFADEVNDFLSQQTPFDPLTLKPVLWVDYSRLTLVSCTTKERLTLDLNLTFRNSKDQKSFTQVVIAEVKQEKLRHSFFLDLMKKYQIREGSISKYCLGMISLYGNLKKNRFKAKLNNFLKINQLK